MQLLSNLDDLSDNKLSPSKYYIKYCWETRDNEYNNKYSVGKGGKYYREAEEEEIEVDIL